MQAKQVLQAYIAKSGAKHGEGSHGGHVIGHTKSGHPIYAHGSVSREHIKPLVGGNKYDVHHLNPDDLDKKGHLDKLDDYDLGNGHRLEISTHLVSEPGYDKAGRHGPVEHRPAEYGWQHEIVDREGNAVEGAEITPALHKLVDRRGIVLADNDSRFHGIY